MKNEYIKYLNDMLLNFSRIRWILNVELEDSFNNEDVVKLIGDSEELLCKIVNYYEKPQQDKFVIKFADEVIKILTKEELEQLKESAIEFDGFESWIIMGKLNEC